MSSGTERPQMRISGPVLDAPDVAELTRIYKALPDSEIEIRFEPHYLLPAWPGTPGALGACRSTVAR